MKSKGNLFLLGSVVFIILAVIMVAIIDKSASGNSSTDVRARAGAQSALKLVGLVNGVNETKGTIEVVSVQFSDSNRAGEPQNLGTWVVTAPAGFNFASVSVGTPVTIGVDAVTFNIASHTVTALTLTTGN